MPEKFFLLGPGMRPGFLGPRAVARLRSRRAIADALTEARSSSLWVAIDPQAADELLQEAARKPLQRRSRLGGLLLLGPPRPESIQPLEDLFSPFVWSAGDFRTLPPAELTEVLAHERRGDLFLGGYADLRNGTLTLVRGDLRRLSVPLSMFPQSGNGVAADPARLAFTDYGNTVRLGDYEAAADAILYEADADYRSRLLARRRAADKTFGASLRRLRLLRGLRQGDFGEIAAKTIARIERGEAEAPHGKTLQRIAGRLGVEPEEITTY